MITGNCLCGAIRFEIKALSGPLVHCHCNFCRRAHSAAFSSNLSTRKENFKLICGQEFLSCYKASNAFVKDKKRYFCSRCGSMIWHTKASSPDTMTIKLGAIEDFPGFDPNNFESYHIHQQSDKPWLRYEGLKGYEITKE